MRLLPGRACNRDRFLALRRDLAGRFLKVIKPKLKLLDAGGALRRWVEPLPPEPSSSVNNAASKLVHCYTVMLTG